jgi:hypothetical protein
LGRFNFRIGVSLRHHLESADEPEIELGHMRRCARGIAIQCGCPHHGISRELGGIAPSALSCVPIQFLARREVNHYLSTKPPVRAPIPSRPLAKHRSDHALGLWRQCRQQLLRIKASRSDELFARGHTPLCRSSLYGLGLQRLCNVCETVRGLRKYGRVLTRAAMLVRSSRIMPATASYGIGIKLTRQ